MSVAHLRKSAALLNFGAGAHLRLEGVDVMKRFLFDIDVHDHGHRQVDLCGIDVGDPRHSDSTRILRSKASSARTGSPFTPRQQSAFADWSRGAGWVIIEIGCGAVANA
jgi:hypothetical protein